MSVLWFSDISVVASLLSWLWFGSHVFVMVLRSKVRSCASFRYGVARLSMFGFMIDVVDVCFMVLQAMVCDTVFPFFSALQCKAMVRISL